ncbi:MAG: hypothetical protein FJW20_06185 [Acidimicrobiia bacterium]|nr:hypothetical protein [Acidimicrobiia bacterium]
MHAATWLYHAQTGLTQLTHPSSLAQEIAPLQPALGRPKLPPPAPPTPSRAIQQASMYVPIRAQQRSRPLHQFRVFSSHTGATRSRVWSR